MQRWRRKIDCPGHAGAVGVHIICHASVKVTNIELARSKGRFRGRLLLRYKDWPLSQPTGWGRCH